MTIAIGDRIAGDDRISLGGNFKELYFIGHQPRQALTDGGDGHDDQIEESGDGAVSTAERIDIEHAAETLSHPGDLFRRCAADRAFTKTAGIMITSSVDHYAPAGCRSDALTDDVDFQFEIAGEILKAPSQVTSMRLSGGIPACCRARA